jgi:hypothetical protein
MPTPSPAESIFFAALGKAVPAERAAYLDEACRGDADLRRRVERLLEAHQQVGTFLEQPLAGNVPDEPRAAGDRAAEAGGRPGREERDETRAGRPGGDAAVPAPDFLAPSQQPGSLGRLDHFEILEVVGRGGMGVVLKGFDEKLRRVVAIKVLAPELAASGTARQRFTREARAAAAVSHEHVVTIHAVEEGHRPPYLVMQFVDGASLQAKLDEGGPPGLREILRIGLQTAEGLAAAHRQGLVHRDVKPANILLENGVERVKLTDFGLARAADDASLTQSGVIAGTPLYMSPEQAAGEPVDHRSDLFSLGSVLYALCTGRPPFRAGGTLAVLKRVAGDAPRPIAELNPEIPGWLCDLIARLHAKSPADRYPSAQAVADLLGRHLAHLQQPNEVAMPGAVARPAAAGPGRKRHRAGPAAAGLALLALGGGLLLLAYLSGWLARSSEPRSQQPGSSAPAEKQPVAEAVLGELRRVVTAQRENLHQVRVNFEAGRVTRLEVCAAEVPLIEARIKVAEAERKSVVALLEDLVRVREEELDQVEARIDAGTLTEADGLSAKARLSEARARLAAARAGLPPTKPFVLPGNGGRAEAGFATLAEAVAAARPGDAVEIRRNGPVVVDPIRVPVALAVRAAEGYRPVLRLSPEGVASNGAILDTKSPLVLEGLEFQGPGGPPKAPGIPALVRARRASLHVAHCRFGFRGEGDALLVTCPADVTARNCEFEGGPNASSAFGFARAGRGNVHLEQCWLSGRAGIDFTGPPEDMSVTLVNNTAWLTGPLLQIPQGPSKAGPAAAKSPVRLHASGNVFYGQQPLVRAPTRGRVIDSSADEQLRRGVVRLDPGTQGKGAGLGGTDLGADLGLVGPGEAYQRWTKTPEYLEWRKGTNALLRAKGGQPPTGVP